MMPQNMLPERIHDEHNGLESTLHGERGFLCGRNMVPENRFHTFCGRISMDRCLDPNTRPGKTGSYR